MKSFDQQYASERIDNLTKLFLANRIALKRDLRWYGDNRFELYSEGLWDLQPYVAWRDDILECERHIKAMTAARVLRRTSNWDTHWVKGLSEEELKWLDSLPLPPMPAPLKQKTLRIQGERRLPVYFLDHLDTLH